MNSSSPIVFALATPHGRSATALIRISGLDCHQALLPHLKNPKGHVKVTPAGKRYVHLINSKGTLLDDCVALFYSNPQSYTGEDSIELSVHGNPIIIAQIFVLLREIGFQDAAPGEFTQRAFLNGKLDLARAEAVHELIHAESMAGVNMARSVSSRQLEHKIEELKQHLLKSLAYLEAHIDFGQDDVGDFEVQGFLPHLVELKLNLAKLTKTYHEGLIIKDGFQVVLCGAPNAGKSTLFNNLLDCDRSLVTSIAGTTRDYIQERMHIENRDFVITDTAGLRETEEQIEALGIQRTRSQIEKAHLILWVIDGSATFNSVQMEEINLAHNSKLILVFTKSDISTTAHEQWYQWANKLNLEYVSCSQFKCTSVRDVLTKQYDLRFGEQLQENLFLISARQQQKCAIALQFIETAELLSLEGSFPEIIASQLNQARFALNEIIGNIGTEEVLGSIFSSFCIGK